MKRVVGIICMVLGVLLVVGSVALLIQNRTEEKEAESTAQNYLGKIKDSFPKNETENIDTSQKNENVGNKDPIFTDPDFYSDEMTVVEIDGYGFVGYLSIPSLDLELPVMSDTDKAKLKLSPCRFSGSVKTEDLVIGAHNYNRHFGKISSLKSGDEVYFTDMDGKLRKYSVITSEILNPDDVEELTAGEFALTLYTCTYGGRTRVVVRCDEIE